MIVAFIRLIGLHKLPFGTRVCVHVCTACPVMNHVTRLSPLEVGTIAATLQAQTSAGEERTGAV